MDYALGSIQLAQAGVLGQLLDGMPIAVARGVVHAHEFAAAPQARIDDADAFHQALPVERGHGAHAGDETAGREIGGSLAGVLLSHPFLPVETAGCQPSVQALKGRRQAGVLIAQTMDQLHKEGARADIVGSARDQVVEANRGACGLAQHIVGEGIRVLPSVLRLNHAHRDAPQVLDEQAAQHNGRSPQLAQGQGLQALIAMDVLAERVGFKPAVGMGDEVQEQGVDPRPVAQAPFPQHRQGPQERGRAVASDSLDLLVDDVKVVEDPLGGGCHDAAAVRCFGDRLIAIQQHPSVLLRARDHRHAAQPARLDRVMLRERPGVLRQALDAEQFGTNGSIGVVLRCAPHELP